MLPPPHSPAPPAPPGYYRDPQGGTVRFWDGTAWRGRYWSWWRVGLTVIVVVVGVTVGFAGMLGMLADPTTDAASDSIGDVKARGVALLTVAGLGVPLALWLLHRRFW